MKWSPAFIGIGAEKSATTWAWTVLNEHPDVCMSQPKELNYFNVDDNFERGVGWYRRHFAMDIRCTGEISPLYMDDHRVAGRIRETFPEARLLVMLRNPFDRAISHLFHDASVIHGTVAELTAADLQKLAGRDDKYLRRSCYASSLRPFFDLFPPEQIGVFYFDQVSLDGLSLARRLYEFVSVDSDFVPAQFNEKVNESRDLRSVGLARAMISASRAARSFPPTRVALNWIYRRTQLRESVIRWLLVDKGRPGITFDQVFTEEATVRLQQDLRELEQLIPDVLPTSWQPTSTPSLNTTAPAAA
ncbi:MAG: sulfotransferase [Fuerstiella sp.]